MIQSLAHSALTEFSHTHCTEICAFLVPANCLVTLQTLIWTGLGRARWQTGLWIGAASVLASLMVLHVLTWFAIGVVRVPTFVLLGLVILCMGCNFWAGAHPRSLAQVLRSLVAWVMRQVSTKFPQVTSPMS